MRLYKVVILANLAFGAGILAGWLWVAREAQDLRRELDAARQRVEAPAARARQWTVQGIVRGVLPDGAQVVITHEPIPDLMGAMTMAFAAKHRALLEGLAAGQRVEFTLVREGDGYLLTALRNAESPDTGTRAETEGAPGTGRRPDAARPPTPPRSGKGTAP